MVFSFLWLFFIVASCRARHKNLAKVSILPLPYRRSTGVRSALDWTPSLPRGRGVDLGGVSRRMMGINFDTCYT